MNYMQIIPNSSDYVLIVAEIYFPLNSTPLQTNQWFHFSLITQTMVWILASDSELMSLEQISTFLSIIGH